MQFDCRRFLGYESGYQNGKVRSVWSAPTGPAPHTCAHRRHTHMRAAAHRARPCARARARELKRARAAQLRIFANRFELITPREWLANMRGVPDLLVPFDALQLAPGAFVAPRPTCALAAAQG